MHYLLTSGALAAFLQRWQRGCAVLSLQSMILFVILLLLAKHKTLACAADAFSARADVFSALRICLTLTLARSF